MEHEVINHGTLGNLSAQDRYNNITCLLLQNNVVNGVPLRLK